MRDAFGGVFTTNLLLVFIFIYVAVTAVSLNYAKAFKVKNAVIDFVEQHAISDLDHYFDEYAATKSTDSLDNDLLRLSYTKTCDEVIYDPKTEICYRGVVIRENRREPINGTSATTIYYDIKTYANWDLGAFNTLLRLIGQGAETPLTGTWAIKGEAKVVVKY